MLFSVITIIKFQQGFFENQDISYVGTMLMV